MPVEILHFFSLGVVMYLLRDFMNSLKPAQLNQVVASWEAVDVK
jgi:hypothetical protein